MEGEIKPEDLEGLTVPSLAIAGQFMALAAMVKLSESPSVKQHAMHALAAAPDAFSWWWAASKHLSHSAGEWATVGQIPKPLVIPEDLQDDVRTFLTTSSGGQRQIATHRDNARVQLFNVLETDHPFARCVARDILASTETLRALVPPALTVLGKSRDPEDRTLVRQHAAHGNRANLTTLARLEPPLTEEEADAIDAALTNAFRGLQDDEREPAATLLARLSPATIAILLLRIPESQQAVIAQGLVGKIGADRTRELIDTLVRQPGSEPDAATIEDRRTAANAVIGQLNRLPEPDQLATALWAAEHHAELDLGPFVQNLRQQAQPIHRITDRTGDARSKLLQLLASKPAEFIETAYGDVASLDDLAEWDLESTPAEATRALARAYGRAVQASKLTIGHVIEATADFAGERGAAKTAPFIGGLMDRLDGIPDGLADLAARSPEGVAAAAQAGHVHQAIAAMQRAGAATSDFVEATVATSAALPIATGDENGATSDGVIRSLLEHIVPAELTAKDADRLTTELNRRRPVLRYLCLLLMRTLVGPQAHQVRTSALARVLRAIRDNGDLARWPIDHEEDQFVAALTNVDDPEVLELAATWLGHSPANPTTLALAVAADDTHSDADGPFGSARAAIADQFATVARDSSADTSDRARNLQHAQTADSAVARATALELIHDTPVTLRQAAATVLAETSGTSEDVTVLEHAHKGERNTAIRQLLATAIRRVQSGDVGEALHNLIHHFGLDTELQGLQPRVAVPESDGWGEAFIHCVDAVRSSSTSTAGDAVQAHIKLGEHLINQALGHTWANSTDPRRQKEGKAILANAPSKPDIGALVNRQDLLAQYPWLHDHASLRKLRSVHPTPTGSTKPVVAKEADRQVAHHLTREVVVGWATAMTQVASA